MRLSQIRQFERRDPFRPFRICVSDGAEYEVRDPNLLFIAANWVILNCFEANTELPSRSIYLEPLHITRVETIED
ncbi:MAG: hypothetical protein H6836_06495 [Planctomycetes bacterium]|nr:hypothetical protein [Planctomycetota bacterium]MCB9889208.1 hypothetical protein [Planctomycetota bacterium]